MQIKNNLSNFIKKPWIIVSAKVLVLIGCLYFIFIKLNGRSPFDNFESPNGFWTFLPIVLILMLVNWYLEALRWKISIQTFEAISISKAMKVVLSGLALNWIFPFSTGDLLARISQQRDKYQATSAAILNRVIMMIITICLGLYGASFVAQELESKSWLIFTVVALISITYLFRERLVNFGKYFKQLKRKVVFQITGLSILRYFIFSLQFFIMLKLFLAPLVSTQLLIGGIGWIFLARSSLPLFFGGAGVREASGIFFFEPYISNLELVLIPVFLIWIINSVVPSLSGLIFILALKARKPIE